MRLKTGDLVTMRENRGGKLIMDDGSTRRELFHEDETYKIHSFTKAYDIAQDEKVLVEAVKFSEDQFFAVPVTSIRKAEEES
ncbi:hypothetical protein GJU41_11720 [Bacillus idriensis]|uniref:Uncharacterized protein n=1 Tax=Metabacillus idriensis TaxID=324768 RepID=A0A6I2M8Y6_9BACI|nr:hypothetical protein [Metabacillus idriensis]MRX54640.1 hypothetical protein [Metabacillus idriensis]